MNPLGNLRFITTLIAVLVLYGCGTSLSALDAPTEGPLTSPAVGALPSPSVTAPASPTPRFHATAPSDPTATASVDIPEQYQVCSPLAGIAVQSLDLPDLLKNPFDPPRPGYDDGHFGIDLAYWADEQGKPMQGLPVQAALSGTVAGVINNRQPYGFAVIIETPVEQFSPQTLDKISLPPPQHALQPALGLSCPDYGFTYLTDNTSIYTLYAHLDQIPPVSPGDQVACGDRIGAVGTTGRSVNPHLHLEVRHGPAGITFPSLAHYNNSATQEEMRFYCLWRISGAFAPFDPLLLFTVK